MLTVKDVSDRLGIAESTVYRLIREGRIPAFKIGGSVRIDAETFAAYLESLRAPSASQDVPSDSGSAPNSSTASQ